MATALCSSLFATVGSAGSFTPQISDLNIRLGALPPISLRGKDGAGTASLENDGSFLSAQQSIWTTVNFQSGTALFTGVPGINDLFWTIQNGPASANTSISRVNPIGPGNIGPAFGGSITGPALGAALVRIQIAPGLTLPIKAVAGGRELNTNTSMGGFTVRELFPIIGNITNTGAPFITGMAVITALNANIIHVAEGVRASTTGIAFTLLPTTKEPVDPLISVQTFHLGGSTPTMVTITFTNPTATATGSKNTTNGVGSITLVSPVRVITQLATGNTPSATFSTYRFVPEPGSLLLIGSGVVGLLIIGRRRLSKK